MTAAQDVTQRDRPRLLTATVGAPAPAVVDLPDDYDATRDFFAGCVTTFTLPRYVFPLGPPSPLSRTLADVVREVAL